MADQSPTFKTIPSRLKGNLTYNTVSEALAVYQEKRKRTGIRQNISKTSLEATLNKIANVRTESSQIILTVDGKPIPLSEVKMHQFDTKEMKEAMADWLQEAFEDPDHKYFKSTERKRIRNVLQPFIKTVADGNTKNYFSDIVSTYMDNYKEVMETQSDRQLIKVLDFPKEMSGGYAEVLSSLRDRRQHAQVFALHVVGGFRPSDLERLTIKNIQDALELNILEYTTKAGQKTENRLRPVLPEHRAIFQQILNDHYAKLPQIEVLKPGEVPAKLNPDTLVFPQGKKWKDLQGDLNAALKAQFGPEYLHVYHPTSKLRSKDPVTVKMLRHHYEGRLVQAGLFDAEARKIVMGRVPTGGDMGLAYASLQERYGPGTAAHLLGRQANDILAFNNDNSSLLEWFGQGNDGVVFDPSGVQRIEDLDRVMRPGGPIQLNHIPSMYVDAYDASPSQIRLTGEMANFGTNLIEARDNLIARISADFNIPEEDLINKKYHTLFKDETDYVLKTQRVGDLPPASRNEELFLRTMDAHHTRNLPVATPSQSRKLIREQMIALGYNVQVDPAEALQARIEAIQKGTPGLADFNNQHPDVGITDADDTFDKIKAKAPGFLKTILKTPIKWIGGGPGIAAAGVLSQYEAVQEASAAEAYYKKKGEKMPPGESAYLTASALTAAPLGGPLIPMKDVKDIILKEPPGVLEARMKLRSRYRQNASASKRRMESMNNLKGLDESGYGFAKPPDIPEMPVEKEEEILPTDIPEMPEIEKEEGILLDEYNYPGTAGFVNK